MKVTRTALALATAATMLTTPSAWAENVIKIGNTVAYSGPVSPYGTISKAIGAYFEMVNAEGGVGGRKIEWISYDDAYSPPKTVEQTRRLIESDEVDLIVAPLGTPTTMAVRKYVNAKKVPQLFVASGSSHWNEPEQFPFTMGLQPSYRTEAEIYAVYMAKQLPGKTLGVLYQNDDFGRDYLLGLEDGLGKEAYDALVKPVPYESTDPTVDSQILKLKSMNVDAVVLATTAKFSAQALKKMHELGWKPVRFLSNTSVSVGAVLQPAGFAASTDVMSVGYTKEASDPQWADSPDLIAWKAFMAKWYPDGDLNSSFNVYGYMSASAIVDMLKRCDGDFSRENIMKAAEAFKGFEAPMLLPGIALNTSPSDHAPIESMQLQRFTGEKWELFGDLISVEGA
ncbi:MAG: ABC transporter substrate-binding protein [Pseudomonadota bacterium]|nr:ABC transporter substrate-binding protein [Pseudomonadota bacterium]